jgi:hypothetical protein
MNQSQNMKTILLAEGRDSITCPDPSGWPLKDNYKHMKSSTRKASHSGMIIIARFHMTAKRQLQTYENN